MTCDKCGGLPNQDADILKLDCGHSICGIHDRRHGCPKCRTMNGPLTRARHEEPTHHALPSADGLMFPGTSELAGRKGRHTPDSGPAQSPMAL